MYPPDRQRRVSCTKVEQCQQAWPPLFVECGAHRAGRRRREAAPDRHDAPATVAGWSPTTTGRSTTTSATRKAGQVNGQDQGFNWFVICARMAYRIKPTWHRQRADFGAEWRSSQKRVGRPMRVTRPFRVACLPPWPLSWCWPPSAVVVIADQRLQLAAPEDQGRRRRRCRPPVLHVAHLQHGQLHYAKRLRLQVDNGALSSVQRPAAGAGAARRRLQQDPYPLAQRRCRSIPSLHLHAQISYVEPRASHDHTGPCTIRTPAAKQHVNALLSPGAGNTVGVGSPVVVTFDRPVPTSKRAAVEAGLTVTSTPAVVGAWHWMSDQEVHWRPPSYWKPGTKVEISSDLQGVNFGDGVWGAVGRHHTSFKIGAVAHQRGQHRDPRDAGLRQRHADQDLPGQHRPGQPADDGRRAHRDREVARSSRWTPPRWASRRARPGYYNETVYWDVRISDGGEFVHAAPWSVAQQGHINVSHGCVNLSPTNAEWFYNWALRGDVDRRLRRRAAAERDRPGHGRLEHVVEAVARRWRRTECRGEGAAPGDAADLRARLRPRRPTSPRRRTTRRSRTSRPSTARAARRRLAQAGKARPVAGRRRRDGRAARPAPRRSAPRRRARRRSVRRRRRRARS